MKTKNKGGYEIKWDIEDSKLYAPWNSRQIANLVIRQCEGHPYTCEKCGSDLTPTYEGWVCSKFSCDYKQNWCHKLDAGFSKPLFPKECIREILIGFLFGIGLALGLFVGAFIISCF